MINSIHGFDRPAQAAGAGGIVRRYGRHANRFSTLFYNALAGTPRAASAGRSFRRSAFGSRNFVDAAAAFGRRQRQTPGGPAEPAANLSIMHGVRASIAVQRTGDAKAAAASSNPEVAPHLSFVDAGGHGYATVRAFANKLEVEFVCVPRPLENNGREDGGPLAYRVTHRVRSWKTGARPRMERIAQEGTLPLAF